MDEKAAQIWAKHKNNKPIFNIFSNISQIDTQVLVDVKNKC